MGGSTFCSAALAEWREIGESLPFSHTFRVEQAGFVELDLHAKSESDWRQADRESALLEIEVSPASGPESSGAPFSPAQEDYSQHMVLFYGEEPFTYSRLLGRLEPGEYKLQLRFSKDSSPEVKRAFVQRLELKLLPDEDPLAVVYRHTPVLYGRCLTHPVESRFTDTPLLLLYSLEEKADRTTIEYHMMFSHEDEGTPAPMLMSKWGRLTDIEWMYRVTLDREGQVLEALYQGPHHVTTDFRGRFAMGGHPVLQAATANGNFTDEPVSSYCFLLPPAYRWRPEQEPRERAMDVFPFAYQVMSWENMRHFPVQKPTDPATFELADPRSYCYVQTAKFVRPGGRRTSVDVRIRLKGKAEWYSSSFGDARFGSFRAAYEGPYDHFAVAVKLPDGTRADDVEAVQAVWLPGEEDEITVEGLKAFFLGEDFLPLSPIQSDTVLKLSQEQPDGFLWLRDSQSV